MRVVWGKEELGMKDFEMLSVKRVVDTAQMPTRAHPGDAGLDLYGIEDFELEPGAGKVTRTGIALSLPTGFVGLVADRSSMAKRGLKTSGGVIDAGYRGEIHIVLWNISGEHVKISKGERIAQLLILPIATPMPVETSDLDATVRGDRGFGSSGK